MLMLCAISDSEAEIRDRRVERLIAELGAGNMSAMGELYELISPDVYAFALSKTANRDNAEDITQDTFIQIYKYAKRYEPKGRPMAWIFTAELNLIRRQYTLNSRHTTYDDSLDSEDGGDTADNISKKILVNELLLRLDEGEREVVVLHIVSGMKHKEIAELLGSPLSTILSRYNRAIKKLQNKVKEDRV